MTALPVARACELEAVALEQRWLVEGLWGHGDVGILGGEPKSYKSFLALAIAVAVASGRPCLGRFEVPTPGPVLLFAAEDALHTVRCRLEGICEQMEVVLDDLDLWVITAPVVRLDRLDDRQALRETIARLHPTLVILDPFVRLHRIDENASAAVAPLLASLRHMQREHDCGILVVHHARKAGATRAGQALRGSSEFHAWGDVTLFLQRVHRGVRLSAEQRAGAGLDGLLLELRAGERGPALAVADDDGTQDEPDRDGLVEQVLGALRDGGIPKTSRQLRARCRVRMATLLATLGELTANGEIQRTDSGWSLAVSPSDGPQDSGGNGNGKQPEGKP